MAENETPVAVESPVEASVEAPVAPTPLIKMILGQKLGMTQIFDALGRVVPVTVLQAGPCPITQIKTAERHGYAAIQVGFGDIKPSSVNKPSAGQFKKSNATATRWLREFRTDKASTFQVGQSLRVDSFVPGDFVDVWGISKGKGFAGAMKRHNFGGGPATHGQSDRARAPGSSGSNTYPGRVFKGKKFPGHLGVERVTVQHLEVVRVVPETNLLMIRGAIPGTKAGLIVVEQTLKKLKFRAPAVPEAKKEKAGKKDAGKAPAAKKAGK